MSRLIPPVFLFALLLLDVACGDDNPTGPGTDPDATIIFVSNRSGVSQIYRMTPEGADVTALTDNTAGATLHDPAWSPDGAKIA